MTIGELIKKYRSNKGITIREFSKICGLSVGYISMLENNRRPQNNKQIIPTLSTFDKIAKAMHMSLNDLFSLLDDNAKVSLTDVAASKEPCLSHNESELLDIFSDLSEEGQEELLKLARLLAASCQYKKHCEPELVEA